MKERKAFLRNAAVSSLGTYGEYILGLFASVWIARSLGPTDFGHYAFIIWLCGWLMLASNNALPMSVIKFVAEARGAENSTLAQSIANRMLRLQVISSIVVVGCFLVAIGFDRPNDWEGSAVAIAVLVSLAVITKSGYTMLAAIGKGYEQFKPEALAALVAGFLNVILVYVWSTQHGTVLGYLVIFAILGALLNLGVRIQLSRMQIRPWNAGEPLPDALALRIRRHLILTGGLVGLSSFTGRTIETLILKGTASLEMVGFFAISGTLTKGAVDFISSGLSATLLPSMARAYGRGSGNALSTMLPNSIRFFWFMGLMIAGVGFLASPGLVDLMFGPRYAGAVSAVQVSLCAAGLTLFAAPINAYQSTADLQGDRIQITILTLVVNGAVAATFIPKFGLYGALISLAATSAAYSALAVWYLRKRSAVQLPLGAMSRMLLAAVLGLGLGILLNFILPGPYEFVASAGAFIVLFVSLSVVFRCWKREDFALAESLVQNRVVPSISGRVAAISTKFAAPE